MCLPLALALAGTACADGDGGDTEPPAAENRQAEEADTAGAAPQEGPALTEVNQFLSFAGADSLADLKLWGGYGGANGAWNFDGYHHGNATVVVPLGWRVEVTYQTLDANVPHSAAVVEPQEEMPVSGADVRLAFQGASTPSLSTGLSSTHEPVRFDFRADEAGRYWIFCGVPGHGQAGMWIWFEVSETASRPDFRTEEGG